MTVRMPAEYAVILFDQQDNPLFSPRFAAN